MPVELSHQQLIQLIVAYACVGAFVFTVAVTCASLVGWIRLADPNQQKKLFSVLVVEVVVVSVAFFGGYLSLNPATSDEQPLLVEFLGYQLYTSDPGLVCPDGFFNVRETYRIEGREGEGLNKLVLNASPVRVEPVRYQDSEGNIAINLCFAPGLQRVQRLMFTTSKGRVSKAVSYLLDTDGREPLDRPAPDLSTL